MLPRSITIRRVFTSETTEEVARDGLRPQWHGLDPLQNQSYLNVEITGPLTAPFDEIILNYSKMIVIVDLYKQIKS